MCPIKERGIVSEMIIILFCPFQIKEYEKLDSEEERLTRSRQIYDIYIMKELLSCSHVRIKFGRLDCLCHFSSINFETCQLQDPI